MDDAPGLEELEQEHGQAPAALDEVPELTHGEPFRGPLQRLDELGLCPFHVAAVDVLPLHGVGLSGRDQVPQEIAALSESDRVHFLTNEPVSISATQIRMQIETGAEVSTEAVPELVLKYIRKYSLYR